MDANVSTDSITAIPSPAFHPLSKTSSSRLNNAKTKSSTDLLSLHSSNQSISSLIYPTTGSNNNINTTSTTASKLVLRKSINSMATNEPNRKSLFSSVMGLNSGNDLDKLKPQDGPNKRHGRADSDKYEKTKVSDISITGLDGNLEKTLSTVSVGRRSHLTFGSNTNLDSMLPIAESRKMSDFDKEQQMKFMGKSYSSLITDITKITPEDLALLDGGIVTNQSDKLPALSISPRETSHSTATISARKLPSPSPLQQQQQQQLAEDQKPVLQKKKSITARLKNILKSLMNTSAKQQQLLKKKQSESQLSPFKQNLSVNLNHDAKNIGEEAMFEFKWGPSGSQYAIPVESELDYSEIKILAPIPSYNHDTFLGYITNTPLEYKHRLVPQQRLKFKLYNAETDSLQFIKHLAILVVLEKRVKPRSKFSPPLLGFCTPSTDFVSAISKYDNKRNMFTLITPYFPLTLRQQVENVWRPCTAESTENLNAFLFNKLQIMRGLVSAVYSMQREGIFHCSLTPDSIRLQIDDDLDCWRVVIDDYQTAVIKGVNDPSSIQLTPALCNDIYVAPEIRLRSRDSLLQINDILFADIYSFGLLCYFVMENMDAYPIIYDTTGPTSDTEKTPLFVQADKMEWKRSHELFITMLGSVKYRQLLDTIRGCASPNCNDRPTVEYLKKAVDSFTSVQQLNESAENIKLDVSGHPRLGLREILVKRFK